jgi:hypothetical protein
MKQGYLSLPILLMSFSQVVSAAIPSPVDHLFVPKGFDNNDNVELVVTGKFPSPCYSRNNISVNVKEDKILVNINTEVKEKSPALCEPLKVPFSEVINVGTLQGGDYEIIVNGSLKEKLFVETSNSQSVDDHLYASVEYVDLGFTGGLAGDATLIGKSVSSCLKLDHVEYISNGKDTYSVLPIMKRLSEDCPEENERIEIPIKYDLSKVDSDKVLLFVRSLDGKSIHSLIDRD